MKQSRILFALCWCIALGSADAARAGAPQPDTRQGDFVHVCQGGPNKDDLCTIPTEATDCPQSTCLLRALSPPIKGTLTIIAHDGVTDWLNGGATNQALTVLLEVRTRDGLQLLSASYQDLATPSEPPQAPTNVIAIPIDENALRVLAPAVGGLLFVQPQSTLAQQLQQLFDSTGTPVLVGVDKRPQLADHSRDGLATVLRFKVKIQFLDAL